MEVLFANGGGEEGGRVSTRSRDPEDDGPNDQKKRRRTGRPRNNPGPRPPAIPVSIAPRPDPNPGRDPDLDLDPCPEPLFIPDSQPKGPVPGRVGQFEVNPDDNQQDITAAQPSDAATASPSPINSDVALPLTVILPPNTPMTEGRNGLSLRGHRPITPENLGPDEMMLPQMTLFGRPEIEITINNAVLSKRYENTFASRKLMELLEQPLQRLDESQIKRILTPRGWIRCTEEVVLWFSLPETSPGHYVIRVLVLPEEHPHPGVSLIIGRPMIEHLDLINRVQALPYVTPFVMQDSVDSHDTVTTFDVIPSHQTRDDGSAHGSGPKR